MTGPESTAYIGLGSNQDDPERQLRSAIDELEGLPGSRVLVRSSLYRTAPVGFSEQPDFVNAVVALRTGLSARELLREMQSIEQKHGRTRSFRNAPRPLDLDLLLYADACIDEPGLRVPHPRMHERAFVLAPLAEIAPDVPIGTLGTAAALLARCGGQRADRIDS